jgi:carboxymethylenebutenolidase
LALRIQEASMTNSVPVPFFYAQPAAGTNGNPAIVVIMEGGGMSQQLLRVCQRLAHEGYTAIAPDVFHRVGGSDADKALAEGWYAKVDIDSSLGDIGECIRYVRGAGATSVGITGFCMGGMFSYLAATRGLDVQAAVGFYGRIADKLGTPACPHLHFFGGNDAFIPTDEIERTRAHHPDQVTVFDDAQHGFMRDGSDAYHADHAPVAWKRTLEFFAEHLR